MHDTRPMAPPTPISRCRRACKRFSITVAHRGLFDDPTTTTAQRVELTGAKPVQYDEPGRVISSVLTNDNAASNATGQIE